MALSDPCKQATVVALGGVPGAGQELVDAVNTATVAAVVSVTNGTWAASKMMTLDASGNATATDGCNIALGTTTGMKLATATNQKLAMHGVTAVVQRSGASQAAAGTTGATSTGGVWGFTTSAQANAIVTLVNELRAALVEKGVIAGA